MNWWHRLVSEWRSQDNREQRKWDALVIGCFLFLLFFLPRPTFDDGSYIVWAQYIRDEGLSHIYHLHYVNYMPINIFGLQAWQLLSGLFQIGLTEGVHYFKIFPLLFDCLTVLLLLRFAKRYGIGLIGVLALFLPNIAFWYNSFIWGQLDSIYTFFVVLTFYLLLKRQPLAAFLAFVLALNAKLQAVIFLPALGLFAWVHIFQPQKHPVRKLIQTVGVSGAIAMIAQFLLFAPFWAHSPAQIMTLIWERTTALSTYVTFNADNFWILVGAQSMVTLDTSPWLLGMSYHVWGYLLFSLATFLAFLPLIVMFLEPYWSYLTALKKFRFLKFSMLAEAMQAELLSLILYIQGLSFFFFLTQMHERYSHPAIVFAGIFALLSKKKAIFLCTCIAYVLNLERIDLFWQDTIDLSQISWINQISALLYMIGLGLAFWHLYRLYLTHQRLKTKP